MPKETNIKRNLPGLLKLHALDIGLYFHVVAIQSAMPSMDLKSAIMNFFSVWNIDESEWSYTTAEQLFYRYSNSELMTNNNFEKQTIKTKYNR
jgi:hypothetical protein